MIKINEWITGYILELPHAGNLIHYEDAVGNFEFRFAYNPPACAVDNCNLKATIVHTHMNLFLCNPHAEKI